MIKKADDTTACEAAFLEHLSKVLPEVAYKGGHGGIIEGNAVMDTWHEFLDDWCAAVEWGQANPNAGPLRSDRKRRVRQHLRLLVPNPNRVA